MKVRTCEGEETQKMWQPNCQLQLEPSLGESILNANLVRYTQAGEYPQAGEESAIVQFHGQPCANVVGFDQLREQPL
ncbi:hypothetical protein HYX70_00865 [Candidatus Saccharibacteria bacterium]|nr:hypothetical protein [Candidatus Saccharibacteria bacterium]